jgi:hypothetical protein
MNDYVIAVMNILFDWSFYMFLKQDRETRKFFHTGVQAFTST